MKATTTPFTLAGLSAMLALGAIRLSSADEKSSPQSTTSPAAQNQPAAQPQTPAREQTPSATQQPSASQPTPATAQRAPAPAPAQPPAKDETKPAGTISAAPKSMESQTDRVLTGRKVRGSDGNDLGRVKDLLVDQHSGEIVYAVISSGGVAGIRDTLRLVPFKALEPDETRKHDFTLSTKQTEWEQLVPLDEEEFKTGRITISDGERRELAQRFERARSGEAATGSAYYTANISAHLIRTSDIHGNSVQAGKRKIGTIEAVLVDTAAGKASALFDPNDRFMDSKNKFIVPLNKFSFGTDVGDGVTTTLARTDFEPPPTEVQPTRAASSEPPKATPAAEAVAEAKSPAGAQGAPTGKVDSAATSSAQPAPAAQNQRVASEAAAPSAAQPPAKTTADKRAAPAKPEVASRDQKAPAAGSQPASASQPTQKKEPELAPTGRTSAEQMPAGTDSAPLRAAQAIRAALDKEAASLARVDVRVNPDNGRIVLRGSVADEHLKKSIEEKAGQAAKGAKIDSQITVEKK